MKTKFEGITYESPALDIIEAVVENGFSASDRNLENPEEGEIGEW